MSTAADILLVVERFRHLLLMWWPLQIGPVMSQLLQALLMVQTWPLSITTHFLWTYALEAPVIALIWKFRPTVRLRLTIRKFCPRAEPSEECLFFKTIVNIGTGVTLNLTNFGIVFGALGMALIFGPDWFSRVMRLWMTVRAIFVVCRDEKFAPHSAIPRNEGQSTEMRSPPHHSSQDQQGSNTHAASPPLSIPRSRGSEYRVAAYPDADEPDLAPPRRQDTEARIGTNSSLPSIGITRRGTAGLS
jgi:hypothetical protein